MKKYLIVLTLLLLVVTGCGNTKKLTCSMSKNGTMAKADMEFDKKDNLTKMTTTMSQEFEKELSKEELETYQQLLGNSCSEYDSEYVDCKIDINSKKFEIVISYDVTKMTNEQLEDMGYTRKTAIYSTMKEDAEADGFTCK